MSSGSCSGYDEEIPLAKGKRCYSVNGFSLHANTATKAHQRNRLEKLIRYIAAFADGRPTCCSPRWNYREARRSYTTPSLTLVRWSGVLAPHSPYSQA